MNHFATQICHTRLTVTTLWHDVNHANKEQIMIQNVPFRHLSMSAETQHLREKKEKMFPIFISE